MYDEKQMLQLSSRTTTESSEQYKSSATRQRSADTTLRGLSTDRQNPRQQIATFYGIRPSETCCCLECLSRVALDAGPNDLDADHVFQSANRDNDGQPVAENARPPPSRGDDAGEGVRR